MDGQKTERNIHAGHRERMRCKLAAYGQQFFDTYELLEILLYYVIPYKDTNPTAKCLLERFGSLHGVLSASEQELMQISGIGNSVARFITDIGRLSDVIGGEIVPESAPVYDTYRKIGGCFAEFFSEYKTPAVAILLLDNSFNLLAVEELYKGVDYSSSAVRPEVFTAAAVKHNASIAVTAHLHPYGPCFPSSEDRVTDELVKRALETVGVCQLEHYVVTGGQYIGFSKTYATHVSQCADISGFDFGDEYYGKKDDKKCFYESFAKDDFDLICRVLSCSIRSDKAPDALRILLSRYRTFENVICADLRIIERLVGRNAAIQIKLIAYVLSRSKTDMLLLNGEKCTDDDIVEFFKGLYIGVPVETVCIMSLNSKGAPEGYTLVSEGVVGASDVMPQKLVSSAVSLNASSVVIAHNHPFGIAEPSQDDVKFTAAIYSALELSRIKLLYHVIVAGQTAEIFDYKSQVIERNEEK